MQVVVMVSVMGVAEVGWKEMMKKIVRGFEGIDMKFVGVVGGTYVGIMCP